MNWTETEDIYLCIAFANVSGNKKHGTDRNATTFWKVIHEMFVEQHAETSEKPADKVKRDKPTQLQCRWAQKVKPDVSLFANLLSGVCIPPSPSPSSPLLGIHYHIVLILTLVLLR